MTSVSRNIKSTGKSPGTDDCNLLLRILLLDKDNELVCREFDVVPRSTPSAVVRPNAECVCQSATGSRFPSTNHDPSRNLKNERFNCASLVAVRKESPCSLMVFGEKLKTSNLSTGCGKTTSRRCSSCNGVLPMAGERATPCRDQSCASMPSWVIKNNHPTAIKSAPPRSGWGGKRRLLRLMHEYLTVQTESQHAEAMLMEELKCNIEKCRDSFLQKSKSDREKRRHLANKVESFCSDDCCDSNTWWPSSWIGHQITNHWSTVTVIVAFGGQHDLVVNSMILWSYLCIHFF